MGILIDCKKIASDIKADIIKTLDGKHSLKLVIVQVGDNPASNTYVKNKLKACEEVGIEGVLQKYPATATEDEVIMGLIDASSDDTVDGVILQLPLPKHFDTDRVLHFVSAYKDVDCFNEEDMGRLLLGKSDFAPCTPTAIVKILKSLDIDYTGKNAVVIGRSNIVGKPISIMLQQMNMNVTMLHSKTSKEDLARYCSDADVIVVATGQMNTITEAELWEKRPIIIDVGINRDSDGKLCGDVDEDVKKNYSSYYTSVPGGVGPCTVACVLYNTMLKYFRQC